MESDLSGTHQNVYDQLLQHPLPHNLQWREVWSMLSALPATTTTEGNKRQAEGDAKWPHRSVLRRPHGKRSGGCGEEVDADPSFPE